MGNSLTNRATVSLSSNTVLHGAGQSAELSSFVISAPSLNGHSVTDCVQDCDSERACSHAAASTAVSKTTTGLIPDDLYVKYITTYELKKMDDGEVYLVPNSYTGDFEPRDVKARLDNLFNGNKVLGE